jgi:hypothetical protein
LRFVGLRLEVGASVAHIPRQDDVRDAKPAAPRIVMSDFIVSKTPRELHGYAKGRLGMSGPGCAVGAGGGAA